MNDRSKRSYWCNASGFSLHGTHLGVGIHRSKIALYIYDKTFEDNDEDKIVDTDFIERNMGFYEILDEWKNLINHDVVSELVEPLYDELESFADCTDTTMSVYRVDKVYPEISNPDGDSIRRDIPGCYGVFSGR